MAFSETDKYNINCHALVEHGYEETKPWFIRRWEIKLETPRINMDVFLVAEIFSHKKNKKNKTKKTPQNKNKTKSNV